MIIRLIAIGKRMPQWVNAGFSEYAKRLPADYQLQLIDIDAVKRGKNANTDSIIEKEGELILKSIPPSDVMIALDRNGKSISTQQLAQSLQQFHDQSQSISIIIGGPEGLSNTLLNKAQLCWSLSALTLPHPLVRIIVAEQCYRAFSIISGHPYHR